MGGGQRAMGEQGEQVMLGRRLHATGLEGMRVHEKRDDSACSVRTPKYVCDSLVTPPRTTLMSAPLSAPGSQG